MEKKKKKGRRRRRRRRRKKKKPNLRYGSLDFLWKLLILYGIMYNWTMVGISMVFKPRALLGFHPNPRFLESRVGKTLNGTRV